jgi:HEAT repeat protein
VRSPKRLILIGLAVCTLAADGSPDTSPDARAQVAVALDALRGVDLSTMSKDEQQAFEKQLAATWHVLLDHRSIAKPEVRKALSKEQTDSFRIIELAHLLIVLEERPNVKEAVAALRNVDPNAYPHGFFQVASQMSALHCVDCLPAVLGMLRLKQLETGIPEHALPIGLETGLVFTLGQYGDAAVPATVEALTSKDCAVRRNAALAVGHLLPGATPATLTHMALEDDCLEARRQVWVGLGQLDDPALPDLVSRRLAGSPPVTREERLAMIDGLALSFNRAAEKPLTALMDDPEIDVAKKAQDAWDGIHLHAPTRAQLQAGSEASPDRAARTRTLLEAAKKKGRFEYEGQRTDLFSTLTPADLPLVNAARAAVLNRLSDECLSEYGDLSYVARGLHSLTSTANATAPAKR